MSSVELILPYPVSTNRLWRVHRNFVVKSHEALAYQHQVVAETRRSTHVFFSTECLAVKIILLPRQIKTSKRHVTQEQTASKICLDLDNCLKLPLDALQGVLYKNDKQIRKIELEYGPPVENGGLKMCFEVLAC